MRIIDVSAKFGYATGSIFPDATIIEAESLDEIQHELEDGVDLVLFGGGVDVNPSICGHDNVASNCFGADGFVIGRDLYEMTAFNMCENVLRKTPKLGICRGSQLLCALSGGKLVQDISGHAGLSHHIVTNDSREFLMTSTHHQMMYPKPARHELIAWTKGPLSSYLQYSWGGKVAPDDELLRKEPEVVFFPNTLSLCVQGHPEYLDVDHPTVGWVRELVNKYLLKKD